MVSTTQFRTTRTISNAALKRRRHYRPIEARETLVEHWFLRTLPSSHFHRQTYIRLECIKKQNDKKKLNKFSPCTIYKQSTTKLCLASTIIQAKRTLLISSEKSMHTTLIMLPCILSIHVLELLLLRWTYPSYKLDPRFNTLNQRTSPQIPRNMEMPLLDFATI